MPHHPDMTLPSSSQLEPRVCIRPPLSSQPFGALRDHVDLGETSRRGCLSFRRFLAMCGHKWCTCLCIRSYMRAIPVVPGISSTRVTKSYLPALVYTTSFARITTELVWCLHIIPLDGHDQVVCGVKKRIRGTDDGCAGYRWVK